MRVGRTEEKVRKDGRVGRDREDGGMMGKEGKGD